MKSWDKAWDKENGIKINFWDKAGIKQTYQKKQN
jgi:hypothetical protein